MLLGRSELEAAAAAADLGAVSDLKSSDWFMSEPVLLLAARREVGVAVRLSYSTTITTINITTATTSTVTLAWHKSTKYCQLPLNITHVNE